MKGTTIMKTLRIVSLALIAVMAIGILVSCGGSGRKLIGTWESSADFVSYTFEKDGTGKQSAFGVLSVDMTYKIKGNELWITSSMYGYEKDEVYTFKISDDKLRLTSSDGTDLILTKKK